MEARLAHPAFDGVRQALARLDGRHEATLETLNQIATEFDLRTESGQAVRFVAPTPSDTPYELRVFNTGCVETRPASRHDFFNAVAWLAFPRTKARINAMHAAQIPKENGVRGRLRDLLTLFDEGGAIVQCADPELVGLVRKFRWKELFWTRREQTRRAMRVLVLGHAVLEKALEPWPGIACKCIFTAADASADEAAAAWLSELSPQATPSELAPLPIFGYPGWVADNARPEYYLDARYFRPFRRASGPSRRRRVEATEHVVARYTFQEREQPSPPCSVTEEEDSQ